MFGGLLLRGTPAAHLSAFRRCLRRRAAQQQLQHADGIPQIAAGVRGQLLGLHGGHLPALRRSNCTEALGSSGGGDRVEVHALHAAVLQDRQQILPPLATTIVASLRSDRS